MVGIFRYCNFLHYRFTFDVSRQPALKLLFKQIILDSMHLVSYFQKQLNGPCMQRMVKFKIYNNLEET
jgi:hypothetical protein